VVWCGGVGERAFCVHFVYASGSGVGQWAPDITPPPPLRRLRLRLHCITPFRSGPVDLCSTSLCRMRACLDVVEEQEQVPGCFVVIRFEVSDQWSLSARHHTTPHHTTPSRTVSHTPLPACAHLHHTLCGVHHLLERRGTCTEWHAIIAGCRSIPPRWKADVGARVVRRCPGGGPRGCKNEGSPGEWRSSLLCPRHWRR
jgi:hypothetical protein